MASQPAPPNQTPPGPSSTPEDNKIKYGSLLLMVIVVVLGSCYIFEDNVEIRKTWLNYLSDVLTPIFTAVAGGLAGAGLGFARARGVL